MSINKTPYKLEVWEDVWVTDATYEIGGYINEVRSVMIGADDMDYDGQAYNIVLTRDIFGTVTLKFSINGSFINTKTGERETNYLTPYLFNEVKLKLAYPYDSTGIDTTWYDFIVKEVSDAKGDKFTIEYNCKFLPQHELAKTGWDIAFDMERSNAIQTAPDFIEAILDNTEWSYQASGDVDLVEYAEEALYIFDAVSSVALRRIEINFTNYTYNNYTVGEKVLVTGSIYIPYSEINSSETYIQVFYIGSETLLVDNHYVIINEDCRYWMHKSAIVSSLVATKYRGKKIKNNHLMEYINYVDKEEHDNDINQYCYVYKDSLDNTFYSYDYYTNNDTSIAYNQVPAGSTRQPGVTYYTKTTSSGVDYYTTYTGENVVGKYVVDTVDAENIVNTETTITRSTKYFSVIRDALNRITTVTIITDNGVITGLIPQYTIEKYRAIEKKESNRFNLIQTVAETFEVWSKAIIGHDANGRITYTDAAGTNGIIRTYDKNITLVTNYGQENPIGFTYGINIRGIKRQVDSNSVTTKLFVKPSENDTAKNGICSIQTADENLAAEIFLFNFDYFIQMGLINEQNLIYDLYNMDDTGGQELGYLRQLGILNQEYDMIIDIILNSGNQSLATQLSIAQEKAFYYKIAYQTDGSQENYDNWKKYEGDAAAINDKIIAYNLRLEAITEDKKELTRIFNTKYIRFIQEGTWGESNYTNANIYYFDALKVLAKASKPNISYNIEVIDLSPLAGYEDYKFEIGDETFIEDTEYFGFESTGVPYREQVIVSEQSNTLDNPTKNTIKIQNYFTQFEDLFKRLTSTVESYELNKNIYARASNLDTNGAVIYQSLQTSFLENKDLTLSDSESVKIDNTGITVTDAEDPLKIVKIVSGGIVLSDDGGESYKTGIYGGKINTALLSAGTINSEEINVRSTFDLGMIEMTGDQIHMYSNDINDNIIYELTISPTTGIIITNLGENVFYVNETGEAYFKGNIFATQINLNGKLYLSDTIDESMYLYGSPSTSSLDDFYRIYMKYTWLNGGIETTRSFTIDKYMQVGISRLSANIIAAEAIYPAEIDFSPNDGYLHYVKNAYNDSQTGFYLGESGFGLGNSFSISSTGVITGASFSGSTMVIAPSSNLYLNSTSISMNTGQAGVVYIGNNSSAADVKLQVYGNITCRSLIQTG